MRSIITRLFFILVALLFVGTVVQADHLNLDYPHNTTNTINCWSCHFYTNNPADWALHEAQDIDDTPWNTLCWDCHNDTDADYVKTHSSLAATNHFGDWSIECKTCHWTHQQEQTRTYGAESYLYTATTAAASAAILTRSGGAAWTTDQYAGYIVIPNTSQIAYNYKILSNTADTLTVAGPVDLGKVTPGSDTMAIIYGKLIKSRIKTPINGYKPVKFFNNTGQKSFADGDSVRDGVCEICHTKPDHFQNDGEAIDQMHDLFLNGKEGTDCIDCHAHNGFGHVSGGTYTCGSAGVCHGTRESHPPHVATDGNVVAVCANCHDTSDFPYFKSGTDADEDGLYVLSETDTCNPCHQDATGVASGATVTVTPPSWDDGDLDCSGCHDNAPSYTSGSPKANSHPAHSGFSCDYCHNNTTTDGSSINDTTKHCNNAYNLNAGNGVTFNYVFNANGGTCSNISCHANTSAQWGGSGCAGCHSGAQGTRTAASAQFSAASHHVQGITVSGSHCYQCHWEANSDGLINTTYHGGYYSPGQPINLVVYGAGTRPTTYIDQGTAISYTPDGTRTEISKLNSHCLSCHSDANNDTEPFGDCKTPRQYAWDRNSIAARYSQNDTATWGKYSTASYPNVAEKDITKAYSAHGNATSNQGGFSESTGLDESIPNTRAGSQNVLCFDCHNSHGSSAAAPTSSYATFNGTKNGGILKNTSAGKGGYMISYTPAANADTDDHNPYNAGADLCFDCHMSQYAIDTPWGYEQTFGATAPIMGYKDGTRFGTSYSGTKQRFAYRAGRTNQGGHMMASASLKGLNSTHEGDEALFQIDGLCTPCHDPHGISPSLGDNQDYGIPLLKGTWLTSPYEEDSPEMTGTNSGSSKVCKNCDTNQEQHWNTDRVTFDTNNNHHDAGGQISEDDTLFAGLCLRCHPKANLTDDNDDSGTSGYGWKSVDRIHETVKGWGSNNEHTFPCSKCHVPHNAGLPRLMQTNCLNFNHRTQLASGGSPSSGSGSKGSGWFPGQSANSTWTQLDGCHEAATATGDTTNTNWPNNQLWNNVTPW